MPHGDPGPGSKDTDTVSASRVLAPELDPAVPLEGMTIRDLVRELTWIEDQSRRQGAARVVTDPSPDWVDEALLRRREREICAELRRRQSGP